MEVKFEIFDKHKISHGIKTKNFLFDSGSENGLMLSSTHIQDFELILEDLGTVNVVSPGNPGKLEYGCFVTIHEINVHKKNILEKPIEHVMLIFSSNSKQTPVIGQVPFSEYECCINYKREKFSINKQ